MNKAEIQIQQLCSLGLDSQLMMPRLLALLHGYIPSFANVFFWFDDNGKITDIFDENTESYAVLPLFLEKYYNRKEREVWCGVEASANYRQALNTEQLWTVDQKTLVMHDFYNDFLRKVGSHWGLHKPIWIDEKAKGLLLLKRTAKEQNFTAREVTKLERISKHVEHALAHQEYTSELIGEKSTEKAALIVDIKGKIHHYTSRAERIMMLSQGEQKLKTYRQYSFYKLPPRLMALLSRFHRIRFGATGAPASETVSNQWGKFKFSVYPLTAKNEQKDDNLYVVQIEHLVPVRILLLEKIDHLNLTTRQTQVCMHIGLGKSYPEIADFLGIGADTVVSHKKELFNKLGVRNRQQLTEKILAMLILN